MIRLGLCGGAQVESALRLVVDELLSLLVDLASGYHEAGDPALAESPELQAPARRGDRP